MNTIRIEHNFVRYYLNRAVEVPGFYFPAKRKIPSDTEVKILVWYENEVLIEVSDDELEAAEFKVSAEHIRTVQNPMKIWQVGKRGFLSEKEAIAFATDGHEEIVEIEVLG